MKLKSNLGGAGKNRPWSLKKKTVTSPSCVPPEPSPTCVPPEPSPTCVPPEPMPTCVPPEPSPTSVPPEPSTDPTPDRPPDSTEDLPLLTMGLRTHKVNLTPSSHNGVGRKLHQLQSKVGQRLSSLDHDWLQRCELRGAGAGQGDKPIMEERRERKAGLELMDFQWSSVDGHSPHSGRGQREVKHEVKSIDDTKTQGSVLSTEDIPHMTTSAADCKKMSEPVKTRSPNHHLKEVETNPEEQRKKILLVSERNKDVIHQSPGPNDGPNMEAASSTGSSNPSIIQEKYKELEGLTEDSKGSDLTSQNGKVSRRKRRRDATNNADPEDVHSRKRQRKAKLTTEEKSPKRGPKKV
ncbi:unnamed protein product [Staurois parvus]|uniref:Uncharacterized protein n=1 Tax=Staurois parvus TaxID=386267 RepID=A0ABN9GRM4_9NEOB|nr:unnamed protein product [Staurois parvus]